MTGVEWLWAIFGIVYLAFGFVFSGAYITALSEEIREKLWADMGFLPSACFALAWLPMMLYGVGQALVVGHQKEAKVKAEQEARVKAILDEDDWSERLSGEEKGDNHVNA